MPVDNPIVTLPGLIANLELIFKIGFILFAIVYFIFSLIVVRQVALMTETVMTEGGSILRALAIVHAGLALGIVILFVGFL